MANKFFLGETVAKFIDQFNTLVEEFNSQAAGVKQIKIGTEEYTPDQNGVLNLPDENNILSVTMGGVNYTPSKDGNIILPNYLQEGETSSTSIILSVSGWVNNTQTINNVKGVSAHNNIFVAPAGNPKAYADAGIYCSAQNTNSLTFVCETVPTENIIVNIQIDTDGIGGWEYVGYGNIMDTSTGIVSFGGEGDLSGDPLLLLFRYYVNDGLGNNVPITALCLQNGEDPIRVATPYLHEDSINKVYTSVLERTNRGFVITNYDYRGEAFGHVASGIRIYKCRLPAMS